MSIAMPLLQVKVPLLNLGLPRRNKVCSRTQHFFMRIAC